jgi:hypothetical protein
VPGFERVTGPRVVATPEAIDGATWHGDERYLTVFRFAPGEAFAIGADGVSVDDPDAIIVREDGFAARLYPPDLFTTEVRPHIEWPLPTERPALAQGSIAGVPAKVYFLDQDLARSPDESGAIVIVQAAYAAELEDRLR